MTMPPLHAGSVSSAQKDLRTPTFLSIIIALLLTGSSLAGLLFSPIIYPTPELNNAFPANDVINLIIGMPILLITMGTARRGSLSGLLLWPGALFFVTYNAMVYLIGMPPGLLSIIYLAQLILSAWAILLVLQGTDRERVKTCLSGRAPARYAGFTLAGLGALIFLRAAAMLVPALLSGAPLPAPELGLHIADLIISSAWVVGGALLIRRSVTGYLFGLGLLFHGSLLFVSLLALMLLQPLFTGSVFSPGDFVVIAVSSLICVVPFALFWRAILRYQDKKEQSEGKIA